MSQTKAQLISDLVQALNFTGTASAPANGLFLSAANTLKLATASTERLKLAGSEVVVNETGANTDFRVEGDTNINLLFCDAGNDRVGIGINNPATALSVGGVIKSNVDANSGASTAIRTENGGTGTTIASYGFASGNSQKASIRAHVLGDGAMMFHNNNDTEKMRIDASGKVGIGTTSPAQIFHVKNTGSHTTWRIENDNADFLIQAGDAGADGLHFYDFDNTAYRMTIDNSGNVGIGTTSPRQKLDVTGNIFASNGGQIQITGTASSKGLQLIGQDDGTSLIGTMGSSGEHLLFRTGSSERMRILVGGPHLLLGGTSTVNDITETSSHSGLVIGNTSMGNGGLAIINSTSGTGRIYFGDAIGTDAARNRGQINYYHSSDAMVFATSRAERMRIDSSGNLLIGTSTVEDTTGNSGPKVINTGDITIDGNRKALVFRSTQSSAHQMSGIQWWNEIGAGVQCAIHGIREAVSLAPGALAFYTSNNVDTSSNNGEGNITEAMRIDSNQRILLGTTVSEDTTGNSGTKVISGGDITIDGDQKAFIFRSSASAAQIQSGIQWWNENGAGVMAKIHCIRSAINKAPGDLAFFTNDDVDTTANNSEGDITERMRILSTGEVDIYSAYTNPVGGTTRDLYVRSDGRLGYLSSIRASKTNIVDLTDISWLNNLKPKAFNIRKKNDSGEYTDNYYDELEYGLIAEDVESVNKELCSYSSDNALEAVQYRKLVVPLLKAVQELTARVAALEAA